MTKKPLMVDFGNINRDSILGIIVVDRCYSRGMVTQDMTVSYCGFMLYRLACVAPTII